MVLLASWVRILGALCCCLVAYAWVPHGPLRQGKRAAGSSFRRASQQQQQPLGGSYVSGSLRALSRPSLRSMSMKPLASSGESGTEAATEGVTYDVAIIGGGPAGSVMAALLAQQHKLKVVLMDPKLDERWIPNYGVWLEEWQGAYVGKGAVEGGGVGLEMSGESAKIGYRSLSLGSHMSLLLTSLYLSLRITQLWRSS